MRRGRARMRAIRCCWRRRVRASISLRATNIAGRFSRNWYMAQTLKTDWVLFTTVVLMVLFGAVMVYSASSVVAETRQGSSYYYAIREAICVVIAIPVMM